MIKLITMIQLFCATEVDPRYKQDKCVQDILECYLNDTEMIYCMDYWLD